MAAIQPSRLERLLKQLDPERSIQEVRRRVEHALAHFPLPVAQTTRWDQFRTCLIHFYCYAQSCALRLPAIREPDAELDWGFCCQLLHREYGRNGDKTAFEMARTGQEGGLRRVLRNLAWRMARQYAENEIRARVYTLWNGLSLEEKLALPDEYLARYGHLIPSELREGSAGRVRADFPAFLVEHARVLDRLRSVRFPEDVKQED